VPDDNSNQILLLEDNPAHAAAIVQELANTCQVHAFKSMQAEEFMYLKARIPGMRVAVVDLDLGGSKAAERVDDGITVIEQLWEIDRAMCFVVFSGFLDRFQDWFRGPHVRPAMAQIPKFDTLEESHGSVPTPGKLAILRGQVERALRSVPLPAAFPSPLNWSASLDDLLRHDSSAHVPDFMRVKEMLDRSRSTIRRLQEDAVQLWNAGQDATGVAIAIYGSCGRGELRAGSDVDISAYVSDMDASTGKFARVAWTQVILAAQSRGLKPDGADKWLVKGRIVQHLANAIEDEFMPIISLGLFVPGWSLEDLEIRRAPLARLRLLQLLLEGKALFNEPLLAKAQAEALNGLLKEPQYGRDLLGEEQFGHLLTQMDMETHVAHMKSWQDIKDVGLRYLNNLMVRIELANPRTSETWKREDDSAFGTLRERIGLPGIVKAIDFANAVKGDEQVRARDLVTSYARCLGRISEQFGGGEQEIERARLDLKATITAVGDLLDAIANNVLGRYIRSQGGGWILNVEAIRQAASNK
jgi:hypothetical protein